MATRFYLPASGSPPVTPVLGSGWEQTTGWSALPTDVTKSNTALANGTARTKDDTIAATDRLDRVYVTSQQLAAQTITGTFSMVQRGFESATANNAWLQVMIRVVSTDGQTQRGTLYAGSTATTQSATVGAENQEFQVSGNTATKIKNALAVSSVSAQAGDRITIEIGYRANNTTSTGSCTLRYGDPTGTADYALTADLTTDLCPWVELSHNVTWQGGAAATIPARVTVSNPATARASNW